MNGFPIKDFVKIVRELLTYLKETESVIPIDDNEVSERIKRLDDMLKQCERLEKL